MVEANTLFFTKGDLIIEDALTADYDPELIKNAYDLTDLRNRLTLLARGKEAALKLADKKEAAATLASVEPMSGAAVYIMQAIAKNYLGSLSLQQTNIRLGEAMLAGDKIEQYLNSIF